MANRMLQKLLTGAFPAAALLALSLPSGLLADDWPEWRGPARDGRSAEKNLPERWAPLWKAPYGGRSGAIVMGEHVYLQNGAGKGGALQERVVCLDADTGKVLWEQNVQRLLERRAAAPRRVGFAERRPGHGQRLCVRRRGHLHALSPAGKLLWERSLNEEFGLVTTHGGRTVSPTVDGDLVIVSRINSGWGEQARGSHRFFAFDKRTGQTCGSARPARGPTTLPTLRR